MPMIGGQCNVGPVQIQGMPQAVPADFIGMHFRGWPLFNGPYIAGSSQPYPSSSSSNPAGLNFKSWRAWDTGYTAWHQIEATAGVYSWNNLDTLISTHRAAGRTVVFVVYGTPTFYSSDVRADSWGTAGAGAYPSSSSPNGLTGLTNFVTALVNRYNKAGGAWYNANNATMGKGIQAVEPWNEPFFTGYPGFWWGTAGQFVDMAWTVYSAVKAADASVIVTSPGCATGPTLQTFLTTSGTINTTKTGKDCCEVIQVHHYNVSLPGTQLGAWGYDYINGTIVGMAAWRSAMAAGGVSAYPLWMGEGGLDFTAGTTELVNVAAQSPSWRRTLWARHIMLGAAHGFKKWLNYTWDTPYLNNPQADPSGIAAAINDVAVIAGKTITAASYVPGGAVSLTFSDATTLTV